MLVYAILQMNAALDIIQLWRLANTGGIGLLYLKRLNLIFPKITFLAQPRLMAVALALAFGLFAWGTFTTAQGVPYTTELVGTSLQNRPITAYRFGNGPNRIAFIGGMHQGDEANSTDLVNKAIEYYAQHPAAFPPDMTAVFIPTANPDGHLLKQRFNSRGVDLNRNWPTADWKPDTFEASGLVRGGGGKMPFSEPETLALWNYIKANDFLGVIWYHSQGAMVVDSMPTANGQRLATGLARLLAASTGYTYIDVFHYYDVSGDASDYLNSKGILSVTMELTNHSESDWVPNLRGFSSAISYFSTRHITETGKTVSGHLLAFWNSNGGTKVMGNPSGDQQKIAGRIWQQFENGTLTLDQETGMVGWLQGATVPAEKAAIPQARPPLPAIAGPSENSVTAADNKSAALRDRVNGLQEQARNLQKDFARINDKLGQPLEVAPDLPALAGGQNMVPPSSDLVKAIKVVLGPNQTASVFIYERGKLIRTVGAFSGMKGHETPRGEFKIHYKNASLQTNKWYEDAGTEYVLKNYASFTGPSLNYSDDWAFHQMRVPVSGPDAGQMQAGPSHGCLALTPADAAWLFDWASDGTPVSIY